MKPTREQILEIIQTKRNSGVLFFGCSDIPEVQCCSSCHWDEQEGYGHFTDRMQGGDLAGFLTSLCCGAKSALDEIGITFEY